MPKIQSMLALLVLGLFVCLGTGCCPKGMGQFKVTLEARPELSQNVTVDVVAVSDTDYQKWYSIKMDDYARQNGLRDEATQRGFLKQFQFDATHRSYTLTPDDPIYKKWAAMGGTPRLFVLVNLNQNPSSPNLVGEGNVDFRRKILPLEICAWPGQEFKIFISPNGLSLDKEPLSTYAIK